MRHIKTAAIATALLGAVCTGGSLAESGEQRSGVVSVVMEKMVFSPAKVEIKKGEVVEWTNKDITPHTATSPAFGDSGALASGKSWKHKFTDAGTFPYTCTFHPTMKGVVVVK